MKVAIVGYSIGNLHSVLKSVQAAQNLSGRTAGIYLADRPEDVSAVDKIIFPGQGAVSDYMAMLHESGLGEAAAGGLENKPFFGICVGAQLLFERSEKDGTAGLGRFESRVEHFLPNQIDAQGSRLKVPHMGWSTVHQTCPCSLFKDVVPNSRSYFAHNYYFAPKDPNVILGTDEYPHEFVCIVDKDNVFATRFHTEKSRDAGLLLLRNFLDWNGS